MKNKLTINPKCGNRLKKNREKVGMTQSELAEKSNYSITQISYIENGKRGMSIEAARIFSKILEIREKYLLGMDDFATKEDYLFSLNNTNRENDCLTEIICNRGYFVEEICTDKVLEKFDDDEEGEICVIDTDKWLITENEDVNGECWSCPGWRMEEYFEDIRSYMIFKLKLLLSKCEKATAAEKKSMKELYKEYFDDLQNQ